MHRKISLNNQEVEYCLQKSRRAKRLRVAISSNAGVVVTRPWFLPQFYVEKFLQTKADWILEKIDKFSKKQLGFYIPRRQRRDYLKYKEQARQLVQQTLAKYNRLYNFQYNQIRIKNHRSRWGSCSAKHNLNFSYRIVYLPGHLAEYIVVHELCHLGELNHSRNFWGLVARSFPDYRKKIKELRSL